MIGVEAESPYLTLDAAVAGFTNEGGLDGKLRFLRNIMGLWIVQSIKKELGGEYTYERLMELADMSDYCGMLCVDDDRLLSPQSMIDAVAAVLRESKQPEPESVGDMMKAVYRGLAASYADAIKAIEGITGEHFDTVAVIGGGSRDRYLNRLTQEYSGRSVTVGSPEATALGNILVQMRSDTSEN